MPLFMLNSSGYVGAAIVGEATKITIRGIWVFPTNVAGTWQLANGEMGSGSIIIPSNLVGSTIPAGKNEKDNLIPYEVSLKTPIKSNDVVYATLSNCKLLIEHGS